jgi:hypothetical protein
MKRSRFSAAAGFGAVIALGVVGFGCSSTSPAGGTGGATGTGGGAATGTGGHGTGGSTGTGGAADAGTVPMCNPSPNDQSACDSNPTCVKNCGVNIAALSTTRAHKTCTCSGPAPGGLWSCPSTGGACVYPGDLALACFALTPTPPACPRDTADGGADGGDGGGADAGGALIRSGVSSCTPPQSDVCGNICGSATAGVVSYQDSSGGKTGYCVCIANTWQCASAAEWPVQ